MSLYVRKLHYLITQLCQHECPQWWFPYAKTSTSCENFLSIADCLGISNLHLQTMIESLRTKWSYLGRCLQRNYNLTIPTIHIYNGQQSGIKTWICFGVFPVNHSPYDQVILNVACPSSIYILIRKNASSYNLVSSTSSNETRQHACDPEVTIFLIFIFVLSYLTTIVYKLKPKTCKGINTNHIYSLISQFV